MADYQTEEEQLEALKRWWEKNGKFVIIAGIIVIAGGVGYKTWHQFQLTKEGKVSAEYSLMMQEAQSGKTDSALQRAQMITSKNPDMYYAILAALMAAKLQVEKGDNEAAVQQLNWALLHTKDENTKQIIRLRLAKVLIAQGKLDKAMTFATFPQSGKFASQYSILQGDIYYKKGEFASAKTAYQTALNDKNLSGQLRRFVQLKLDNLGGAAGAAL